MHEILKHRSAYAVLLVLVLGFVYFFIALQGDLFNQRLCIIAAAVLYFFWGVTTHVKTEHITRYVLAEYAGISLLGALILLVLTV